MTNVLSRPRRNKPGLIERLIAFEQHLSQCSSKLCPSLFVLLRGVKTEKASLVHLSEINQLFSVCS